MLRRTTGRLIVVLSALGLVLSLVAANTFTTLSPQEAAASVDLGATPKGWVPVDFGRSQLSVPPSWSYDLNCPGMSGPSMDLELVPSSSDFANVVHECESGNSILLVPYSAGGTDASEVINGIHLYDSHGVGGVPSLGVRVTVNGSIGNSVFQTIAHSPRGFVLASGASPPVPMSWHRVTYDGISFEVPSDWPQLSIGGFACGGPPLLGSREVIFSSQEINTGISAGPWNPVI